MKPGQRSAHGGRHLMLACSALVAVAAQVAWGQERVFQLFRPDQHAIPFRDPASLPPARLPAMPSPATVSDPRWNTDIQGLGLDEAIRVTLANSQVIRVLTGVTATASGETIYDPAITVPAIDQAKARFDPTVTVQNNFSRQDNPVGAFDPLDPSRALIVGLPTTSYDMNLNVTKVNPLGGTAGFGVNVNPTFTRSRVPLPLNPQTPSNVNLSYTQPLLAGAGVRANMAPIVIARLNAERSFFQFKDTVQQSVRGVVQAYWNLVFARTDVWARRQQVEQGEFTLQRAEARMRTGLGDISEVSQARSALANFKATLIGSEANELNQEAALASIMGLPPQTHFLPLTPPSAVRLKINWDEIVKLAQVYRPDLIELKLILEADRQSLLLARNQAQPQLNATAFYQWNGLEGTMPNGQETGVFGGSFTNWTLGVNFAVPVALRASRAGLRQQELILTRDQANLDQALLTAVTLLAADVRNLDQFYEEYEAFRQARMAARINLERQVQSYRQGRTRLLDVLTAITDWGNAVSAESQALTQYNADLAGLELETGTILETHGIRFFEERYCSLGPLGRLGEKKAYPLATPPGPNEPRYPEGKKPAEDFFNLESPLQRQGQGQPSSPK
jgi:outer membrane protein TolC